MSSRSTQQLGLLLYKNLLLRRRHYIVTALEIIIPVVFSALLLLIRTVVDTRGDKPNSIWPDFPAAEGPPVLTKRPWIAAYAPNSTLGRQLAAEAFNDRALLPTVRGFASEEDMVAHLTDASCNGRCLGGVVFSSLLSEPAASALPAAFSYKIRLSARPAGINSGFGRANQGWQTVRTYPAFPSLGPRNRNDTYGGRPGYRDTGFLYLQNQVNAAVMKLSGISAPLNISMQRMPYPSFEDDPFLFILQSQLGFFLLLSFIFSAATIVRNVVIEKERRLKETMKMMGLRSWLHWTAWHLNYFIFSIISVCACVGIFYIRTGQGSVLKYSDASVLIVFLLLYMNNLIFFCFAISTFFNTARAGTTMASIIYFVTYLPFSFMQQRIDEVSVGLKLLSCLLPNMGLALGANVIGQWENTGTGVHWNSLARGPYASDAFSLLHVMLAMIVSSALCMLIAWYKENVRPGTYGYPLPWYFPFTKTYWCGQMVTTIDVDCDVPGANNPNVEADPVNLQCSIGIDNLTKVFGSGRKRKVAVDNLRLRIYQGQITALLGHNGAGKTTTMAMITGFIPPSSGNVVVNGISIRNSVSGVRKQLGLCPQHNVLFHDLTVWEHLWFFARLKNFPKDRLDAEINRMIVATHLEPKRDWLAGKLSGGMKRKLCVAIALIGDSKIVILDEPSSGMDPSARRELWTFLQAERAGRTILLTTHYMDEADILGDRIAIMAEGKLQCAGSSLFLKSRYGAGYHLTMVKAPRCDQRVVTSLIQEVIPSARMDICAGEELSFILPVEASASFETLFERLERDREILGIASFGASVTTMEEVFLKVGSLAEKNEEEIEASMRPVDEAYDFSVASDLDTSVQPKKHSGFRLFLCQFRAIFVKRSLVFKRSIVLTVVQLLVPIVCLVLGLLVLKTAPGNVPDPALSLTLDKFRDQVISYGRPVSAGPSGDEEKLVAAFRAEFASRARTSFANFTDSVLRNRSDAIKWLLDRGRADLAEFNQRYIVSAYAAPDEPSVAFFNNEALHSPGIALNALSDAFLKAHAGSTRSLLATNHPLPKTEQQLADDSQSSALPVAINAVFGLSILSASFCLFVVRERASKVKHLHFVSATFKSAYWLATFAWDLLTFLLPCICLIIVFAVFKEDAYSSSFGRLMGILLLLVLYGWAAVPQMYCYSHVFSIPSSAFQWMIFFNVITGMATLSAVFILETVVANLKDMAKMLRYIFIFLFPGFGVGRGLTDYYTNYVTAQLCTKVQPLCLIPSFRNNSCCRGTCGSNCADWTENFLSLEAGGIGLELLGLFLQGILFFCLCLLIDSDFSMYLQSLLMAKSSAHLSGRFNSLCSDVVVPEDSDVVQQRLEVKASDIENSKLLVFRELSRYFRSHCAVDNLSCAVSRGDCFGLLGVNGAGKTTTFKMLTGDLTVSGGDIFVNGISVTHHVNDVQRQLGYCPQFDALLDTLTARETLTLFARLRGRPEAMIPYEVKELLESLLLQPHADRLVGTYSGGNKRKLSAALAMVGGPQLICLDEPTSGMDAVARRRLWKALSDYRMKGNTLVLTTHSMEECEALCTKMAVMVNGQLKCFGSSQHLKNKFGSGYTLLVQVPFGEREGGDMWVQKLQEFVRSKFPSSELKDIHQGILHYHLHPAEDLTWSRVFGTMERNKTTLKLENYSVSQTTLEQIFIHLARSQLEPEEKHSRCFSFC